MGATPPGGRSIGLVKGLRNRRLGRVSYQFYNFLHLVGMAGLLAGYGALLARAVLAPENKPIRVWGAVLSGLGLVLLLVAGFGMQAKGGWGWPLWLLLKIVIWIVLGFLLSVINKRPEYNKGLWALVLALVVVVLWLGQYKPAF